MAIANRKRSWTGDFFLTTLMESVLGGIREKRFLTTESRKQQPNSSYRRTTFGLATKLSFLTWPSSCRERLAPWPRHRRHAVRCAASAIAATTRSTCMMTRPDTTVSPLNTAPSGVRVVSRTRCSS